MALDVLKFLLVVLGLLVWIAGSREVVIRHYTRKGEPETQILQPFNMSWVGTFEKRDWRDLGYVAAAALLISIFGVIL